MDYWNISEQSGRGRRGSGAGESSVEHHMVQKVRLFNHSTKRETKKKLRDQLYAGGTLQTYVRVIKRMGEISYLCPNDKNVKKRLKTENMLLIMLASSAYYTLLCL